MVDISPLQILIVLVIALIAFGPSRLPEMGRSVGRGLREFRGAISSSPEPGRPRPAPPASAAAAVDLDDEGDLDGVIVPGARRPGTAGER